MNIDVKNLEGKTVKQMALPAQFQETYEPDLIRRAIDALLSHLHQPYGAMYHAGLQGVSSKLSRRRRNYKGSYGHSISRAPRKTIWRRGMQFGWVGAQAPGTRGGRRANPPKPERDWTRNINKNERRKAVRSALSALVQHNKIIVLESPIETVKKTQELITIFEKIGLTNELTRTSVTKIRAGAGKLRGRKHVTKQGPILVLAQKNSVESAIENIPGFESVQVRNLNAFHLTHGNQPRLTIWSEEALHKLEKEKLFAH